MRFHRGYRDQLYSSTLTAAGFGYNQTRMVSHNDNGSSPGRLKFLVRALRHRNYRLFFAGQGVSVVGTWMQMTAMGWLIPILADRDHRSAEFYLGLIPFIGQLPTFCLPLLTGVLADRWNRRRVLMVTQALSMIQALALAVLVYADAAGLWQVAVLALALGLINSLDIPTRQSFVVDMVDDRGDLSNAIALNSSLINAARIVGPLIAGAIIALIGIGNCFLLNGLSFIAVLAALGAMRLPPPARHGGHGPVWQGMVEGFRYVRAHRPIRAILMLLALVSFMGVSYAVLMPVVARDILHGDVHTYSTLLSSAGVGALIGVVFLAFRSTVHGLKKVIAICAGGFGVGLIAFGFSRFLWLSVGLMVACGFFMMVTIAACNTFLQAVVDDDKRGRVMSLWTMSFMGMAPFGSLFTGALGHAIGPMAAISVGGAVCLAGAIVFATRLKALRQLTRDIYVRKGLIPDLTMASANPQGVTPAIPSNGNNNARSDSTKN